ncbi:SPARC [Dermacentor andersoni]|uniref:SPARC n=1 Tax=Dermacentor andersoni TaxID=34620 RepID=UPI003B3B07BB
MDETRNATSGNNADSTATNGKTGCSIRCGPPSWLDSADCAYFQFSGFAWCGKVRRRLGGCGSAVRDGVYTMKAFIILLLVGFVLAVEAKKHHTAKHVKKHFSKKPKDVVDIVAEDEKASILKDKSAELDAERVLKDPCSKVRCGPGRECVINEDMTATCECVTKCQPETDPRRKVCSNHNQTWDSDCELYQMRCLCEDEKEGCKGEKYEHVHVDYYGACRDLPKCADEEMEDFPRRMREWLFNVMQDLARRHELNEPYKKLEEEAESLQSRQWVNAVIWKFCELDSHPYDRAVSRHELFPLRAPLLSMEHCIAPFLNGCDKNDDHTITLKEWGECLGLEDGEIQDRCAQITA